MPDLEAIRRATAERRDELQRELDLLAPELVLVRQILDVLDGGVMEPVEGRSSPRPPGGRGSVRVSRSRPDGRRERRSEQALGLIRGTPGITSGELSRRMEINPQYVYRVLPKLAKAGRVVKIGQGYMLPGEQPE